MEIRTDLDFRRDCWKHPGVLCLACDPDTASDVLHRYHRALWGRPLPDGQPFGLSDVRGQGRYLVHRSEALGEFWLRSDAVIQTFTRWTRSSVGYLQDPSLESQREAFMAASYTVGGMMLFPHDPTSREWTLNQARGFSVRIADRIDLTLECIRRLYRDRDYQGTELDYRLTPLGKPLTKYGPFFDLFGSFENYVAHFLLEDLLDGPDRVVEFWRFNEFRGSAIPDSLPAWRTFRDRSLEFVEARNRAIERLAPTLADPVAG